MVTEGGGYNVGTIFEVGQRNNPYFKVVGLLFVCLSVTSVTILNGWTDIAKNFILQIHIDRI